MALFEISAVGHTGCHFLMNFKYFFPHEQAAWSWWNKWGETPKVAGAVSNLESLPKEDLINSVKKQMLSLPKNKAQHKELNKELVVAKSKPDEGVDKQKLQELTEELDEGKKIVRLLS